MKVVLSEVTGNKEMVWLAPLYFTCPRKGMAKRRENEPTKRERE
jgi:hypothetical protein